jgi:hypothetical protein
MKSHHKVPLLYGLFGVVWILTSDHLVRAFTEDPAFLTRLQTFKGWFFVIVSTFLIYSLMKAAFHKEERVAEEKRALFDKTLEGSCHILLNYLNQMQLVTLEAETCRDFDKDLLKIANKVSHEAADELRTLQRLDIHTPGAIEALVYRKLRT